jgi:hypothetical protein
MRRRKTEEIDASKTGSGLEGWDMKWKRAVHVMPLCLMVMLGSMSCGTQTTLETNWHIPLSPGDTFSKLAIIALLKTPESSKEFELAVVDDFQRAGVVAIPGFSILKGDADLTQEEMERRVKASGADGVLFFKMIAVDETQTYVPPTTYVPPPTDAIWWKDPVLAYYSPYPHHYYGYWHSSVQVVMTPGYWETESTDRVESTLYRTSDSRLVWTAVSSTYDPSGNYDLASSMSGVVLKNLEGIGLIKAK